MHGSPDKDVGPLLFPAKCRQPPNRATFPPARGLRQLGRFSRCWIRAFSKIGQKKHPVIVPFSLFASPLPVDGGDGGFTLNLMNSCTAPHLVISSNLN
jgi:hypothetical protein